MSEFDRLTHYEFTQRTVEERSIATNFVNGVRILAHCEHPCSSRAYIMKTLQCSIRASICGLFIQKYKSNSF
jgi:hypothetical protein